MTPRHHVATRLGLPDADVPPVRSTWCHGSVGPHGELVGRGSKTPSDLEANVGGHVDTQAPSKNAEVCGSVPRKTTDLHPALGLAWPVGTSTSPANTHAGSACIAPRAMLAVPVVPGHVQLGDSANAITANDEWLQGRGAIAIVDDNRRHEPVEETSW